MMRRPIGARRAGQIWSSDLAVSSVIFVGVCLLASTIITQIVRDDQFADVRGQASVLAELLVREGYPAHWTADDIIKVGIASEHRMSPRKLQELALLDNATLRRAARVRDDFYIYISDDHNITIPIAGSCGIGDLVVASISNTTLLDAAAIVGPSSPVADSVAALAPRIPLESNQSHEVLILEGLVFNASSASTAATLLDMIARRGITIFIIGDPGASVLGVRTNATPVDNITLVGGTGGRIVFPSSGVVSVSGTMDTIDTPDAEAVTHYSTIAIASSGKAAYATWLFHDSRVWYFASSDGILDDGTAVIDHLSNATRSVINASSPSCSPPSFPDAEQMVLYTRAMPYRGEIVYVNAAVWRSR
ncbi:TPA: hypothetical protein HA251_07905 [Candidatus Woesearchaeota archaeon]|nr:hypothetical protein [Candidatus Woesearchaeota archaeon]